MCSNIVKIDMICTYSIKKGKDSPIYFRIYRECLEDTYPGPSAFEIGWPVSSIATFVSPLLPPGTHSLLGEQCASIQSKPLVGLEP